MSTFDWITLSSPPVFSGVRVTRSLVFCVVFNRSLFVLFHLAIVLSVTRTPLKTGGELKVIQSKVDILKWIYLLNTIGKSYLNVNIKLGLVYVLNNYILKPLSFKINLEFTWQKHVLYC
jgi:hypothetical protein